MSNWYDSDNLAAAPAKPSSSAWWDKDSISTGRAALEGYKDTASFGFADEVRGLSRATGLPEGVERVLGGFGAPIGAARVLYEHATGQNDQNLSSLVTGEPRRGPATAAYERERDVGRAVRRQAEEEHPNAFLAGQVGGGVATTLAGPVRAAAGAATVGGRMAAGAKQGAVIGGLYGFGSGEGLQDSLEHGAIGAGTGAVIGGAVSPVVDVARWGAGKIGDAGRSIYTTIRSEANPSYVDREAGRRIAVARNSDIEAGHMPSADVIAAAEHGGVPLNPANTAGERTLALARSAANQSPEARAALTEVANDSFAGQSQRTARLIKDMTGGANAAGDLETLQNAARGGNRVAYGRAYAEGSSGLWSPELERLAGSDAVSKAMQAAAKSAGDEAIVSGHGAMNPRITFTPDGRMQFNRGPTGMPTYPDLQYWDLVRRELSDAAQRAGRGTSEARRLNNFATAMNAELDHLVPSYAQARAGAAAAFGARDALEAGQKFVGAKGQNATYGGAIAKMNPAEKELLARGFASELSDRILELKDSQNILKQAFVTSPASKQRIVMALGQQRADQLEVHLRAETMADRLREALGNSSTARQLAEMGLAGAGSAVLGHGAMSGELDKKDILGAVLLFGAAYGKHRVAAAESTVARRIGEMLASNDPQIMQRGTAIVARTPWLRDALRTAGDRLGPVFARTGTPLAEPSATELVHAIGRAPAQPDQPVQGR